MDPSSINSFLSLRWGPCKIGLETVENYIIRRCENAGGGYTWERVVGVLRNQVKIFKRVLYSLFDHEGSHGRAH